ncbi:trypsin-like peptidase domain-containing protein [Pseudoalteromonas sp. SG41-2]|uniref:S1 family peptidase n=1 Tax=Pseudoalteromonas sp. SG41-2 TaxID=2760978 RepID=UPI001603A01A|nr:serine protease [Pseudoalteromonas sp. SG41-2]MBB1480255.1 trypsin-like peptidase domain-containing protein [Pseudoalteromonas sp. SG41-2]
MFNEVGLKAKHVNSAGAIAFVSVEDEETQDCGIGTAFHVGDGIFVTAKHVVQGKRITEVATTKRIIKKYENDNHKVETKDYLQPQKLKIIDGPRYSIDGSIDVAVFKVDIEGIFLPKLTFDSHTKHDIDDSSFLLDDVLTIGYPPIPFTIVPIQVASLGQVNAVVDVWHSKHPHFIVSSMARGGYSGGPTLCENGKVIGIVTESLVQNDNQTESGFMSVLCAEAVILEIKKYYDFDNEKHGVYWEFEQIVEIKLRNPKKDVGELNPQIPDVVIHVCDIDPDACGHIECDDPKLLLKAIKLIEDLCSVDRLNGDYNETVFEFYSHSYGETLQGAAYAVKNLFIENDYIEISAKDNFCVEE